MEVLKWISEVKAKFPHLYTFIDLLLVSGLRFIEAVNSYNLIISLAREGKLDCYYDAEKEVLEHYGFKQLFLRNTKKAFVSFVPKQLVQRISKEQKLTIYQIRNPIKRSDLGLRFGEIRDYFATFMTKWLNAAEIDFLQGRVGASVFMRSYFNPALIGDLKQRVFKGIADLKVIGWYSV